MGVFDGEEFSRMVRAWTHGYDVYAPQRAVVFHDYGNPTFHTGDWSAHGQGSYGNNRIKLLMKGGDSAIASDKPIVDPSADLGIYGLGKARSLAQFEDFSGIPVRTGGSGNNLTKCADLNYVAYSPEPGPHAAAPPVPPTDTHIPRNVVKGSDKSQWPPESELKPELAQGAQGFVLAEQEADVHGSGHSL